MGEGGNPRVRVVGERGEGRESRQGEKCQNGTSSANMAHEGLILPAIKEPNCPPNSLPRPSSLSTPSQPGQLFWPHNQSPIRLNTLTWAARVLNTKHLAFRLSAESHYRSRAAEILSGFQARAGLERVSCWKEKSQGQKVTVSPRAPSTLARYSPQKSTQFPTNTPLPTPNTPRRPLAARRTALPSYPPLHSASTLNRSQRGF